MNFTIGSHVTMKILPAKNAASKKWLMLSGVVLADEPNKVVIERTVYDDWRCTEKKYETPIEKWRIKKVFSGA